jgi:hypothetical protein
MVKPTKLFWKVGKHVLRYLKGTSEYGLWYRQTDEVKFHGFTDADWAGNPMEKKSTSGGIFSMGSCYNPNLHHTCLLGIKTSQIPSFPKHY